jgi:hypothetical protein
MKLYVITKQCDDHDRFCFASVSLKDARKYTRDSHLHFDGSKDLFDYEYELYYDSIKNFYYLDTFDLSNEPAVKWLYITMIRGKRE